jgi:hypothetical protein
MPSSASPSRRYPGDLTSEIAIDGQSASPSTIPASDDSGMPQQVVEVANDKQKWEIFASHSRYCWKLRHTQYSSHWIGAAERLY